MGLALASTFAFGLWIILWALGAKGFDAFLVTLVILVVAATVKSLGRFLPGASRRRGSDGGW